MALLTNTWIPYLKMGLGNGDINEIFKLNWTFGTLQYLNFMFNCFSVIQFHKGLLNGIEFVFKS